MKRDFAAAAAKSLQSCPTLCDPTDGSPPGSSIPGILQARTLEWVAISFSNAWKWKVKMKSLSRVRLLGTPWTAAYQAPPSMRFARHRINHVRPTTVFYTQQPIFNWNYQACQETGHQMTEYQKNETTGKIIHRGYRYWSHQSWVFKISTFEKREKKKLRKKMGRKKNFTINWNLFFFKV